MGHARVDVGDSFLEMFVKVPAGLLWVTGSVAPGFSAYEQRCVPCIGISSYQTPPPGGVVACATRARTRSENT